MSNNVVQEICWGYIRRNGFTYALLNFRPEPRKAWMVEGTQLWRVANITNESQETYPEQFVMFGRDELVEFTNKNDTVLINVRNDKVVSLDSEDGIVGTPV